MHEFPAPPASPPPHPAVVDVRHALFTRRAKRAGSLPPHENPPRDRRARLPYRARRHGRPRSSQDAFEEGRAARDRASGRVGLPARAHAGRVRPRRAHGRRLHRARPGLDQGRRARRAARERDLGDDRRGRPSRVREPPHDEDDRRPRADRLVHRGLHARRAQDAARQGAHPRAAAAQHALQRPLPGAHLPGGHRPLEAPVARAGPADRDLPRDQAPDVLPRDRAAARGAAGPDAAPQATSTAGGRRSSSSPSRSATSRRSTGRSTRRSSSCSPAGTRAPSASTAPTARWPPPPA